jgi:hypothetical protein
MWAWLRSAISGIAESACGKAAPFVRLFSDGGRLLAGHASRMSVSSRTAPVQSYAVAWSEDGASVRVGKLELLDGGLRIESGTHQDGRISVRRVTFRDVVKAEMAPVRLRIAARPTIVVTSLRGVVAIAPAGIGAASEALALLQAALAEAVA